MKLEASHYDTIEWKPIAIDPGTFINKPEHTYKSKLGKKREIILKSPCRVDVGLIDYSALKFTDQNDYKAGEMSFACDVYTYVKVKLLNRSKIIIDSDRPTMVKHYALLVKKVTDYQGGFEIKTIAPPYHHVGFGSSAVMAETTALAINIGSCIDKNLSLS